MKYHVSKYSLLSVLLIGLIFQGCSPVSKTVNKKTGVTTVGGVVNSKDHYSLLIQKRSEPDSTATYFLFLNAASRVMLSDSLLNSEGKFELFLTNGEKLIIEGVKGENNPLGFGGSIGFSGGTTESKIMPVLENPIQKLVAFGILETEFSAKQQKEQQEILNILINE